MQDSNALRSGSRTRSAPAERHPERARVRLLLLVEGVTFVLASLAHRGVLVRGYEHARAAVAETVIGAVLLAGVASSWARPAWTRASGLLAHAFALAGTLVGISMVAIGVGPRTGPDVAYHAAILLLLVLGLMVAARSRLAA